MKLFNRLFAVVLITGLLFPLLAPGQQETMLPVLKQNLRRLAQKENHLRDTAYIKALLDLAYEYSTIYPDSALLVLAGNADLCRAINYGRGEADTYMIMGDALQFKGVYDTALLYYERLYDIANKIGYTNALPFALNRIGMIALNQGNYREALQKFYEALKQAERINDMELAGAVFNNIAIVHLYQKNFTDAALTYRQGLKLAEQMADPLSMSRAYNGLGEVALQQKKTAQALMHFETARSLAGKAKDEEMMLTSSLSLAEAYYALDSLQTAELLFNNAKITAAKLAQATHITSALIGLAKVHYKRGLLNVGLQEGLQALQKAEAMGQVQLMRDANEIVAKLYEANNDASNALKYYKAWYKYADSINNLESKRAAAAEKAGYEFAKKESEFKRQALQQRWITLSALSALLLLAMILWMINRNRKRLNLTNKELHRKNQVIEMQKARAEETLFKLQSTQAQLIQSEKMASLGELTAGIAHEIQNPLNFVNNFSEVSNELVDEMKSELATGNLQLVTEIANDIQQNLQKIHHHGKRADGIVKGMLQHSRISTGLKEPTDINALCDEYLRLSYHGLRAKDKSFSAAFITEADENVGIVNVVPQDIGRVLLNLFNNAFYAVQERQQFVLSLPNAEGFTPLVKVTTKRLAGGVKITVSDNGAGIPQNIIDKIFQPFFTTKPTGRGTGLGLSLSYDIIKTHGGNMSVQSKEGEGSEFVIELPA